MFKIVKSEDIPAHVRRGKSEYHGRRAAYPWDALEVGDGFFVAQSESTKRNGETPTVSELHARLSNIGRYWTERNSPNTVFRVRSQGTVEPRGVWVIRTQ